MIDFRNDFNSILNTDEKFGRWLMVRHYLDIRSPYWKPERYESVNGPAFEYTDRLVRGVSSSAYVRGARKNEGVEFQDFGETISYDIKYYLSHDVDIKENDEIYELGWEKEDMPIVVAKKSEEDLDNNKVFPKKRFKVRSVQNFYGENGKIQYKIAFVYQSITI